MDDKDKNAKKDSVGTSADTEKCKCGHRWKVIAGIIVLAIILLNTFWNMMESKIAETAAKMETSTVSEEIESLKTELKSDLAKLDSRISEAEKGTTGLDAIKADIVSIKKAGEDFEKKLLAVIKAEELKLTGLEKDVAAQKAYIEELKTLLAGAVK